jgi:hypothetical protein
MSPSKNVMENGANCHKHDLGAEAYDALNLKASKQFGKNMPSTRNCSLAGISNNPARLVEVGARLAAACLPTVKWGNARLPPVY